MHIARQLGNPISVRVADVIQENLRVRTVLFDRKTIKESPQPGQFLMIWVPGVDEIPMSVSVINDRHIGFTVLPVGDATNVLASLDRDDWIGVRGPFGNGFSIDDGEVLVVGGGSGVAALRPLVHELLRYNATVTFILAAKTRDELIFHDEFSKMEKIKPIVSTDDGSVGEKGLATDVAEHLLKENQFDRIYTCGPELMMKRLHDLAKSFNTQFEASLERFMKCGCGICGSCALDPTGELVCVEGPVFSGEQLDRITEFGEYHRNSMGVKEYFRK